MPTRDKRIERYRENAALASDAAELASNPKEREQHLQLAAGWKRLEEIERRDALYEAMVKDASDRQ